MTLRHGGCPEMTRSIGIVDRMRWMSALVASAVLVLGVVFAYAASHGQLSALQIASSSSTEGGSSAPLDPRIAGIAAHRPEQVIEAIVQFKGGVSVDRSRWNVARVSGHMVGVL